MKYLRLILVLAFLSVIVSACSGPPITYPQPKDDDPDSPPTQGFTAAHHR